MMGECMETNLPETDKGNSASVYSQTGLCAIHDSAILEVVASVKYINEEDNVASCGRCIANE